MPATILNSELPLSIHLSPDGDPTKDCVLLNGRKWALLQFFMLAYDAQGLRTKVGYIGGCPSFEDPPENALSNSAFPLRLRFGNYVIGANGVADTPPEMITLCSRPIGFLRAIYVNLRVGAPREVRMVFHTASGELMRALHDLDVDAAIDQSAMPPGVKELLHADL
jgi:hypothetical protein